MVTSPLGIIAGGGKLPGDVAKAAAQAGRPVFIIALEGFAEPEIVAPFPHKFFRLGDIGAMRRALVNQSCADIVLIGPVKRPSLMAMRPDSEGARLIAKIGRAAFSGDDGLLAAIVRVIGEEGFRVIGAHEILKTALAPAGLLSKLTPDATAMLDIRKGIATLRLIGPADIGQACVIQQGIVLAVEAVEGTDAMLSRVAALVRPGPAGVLVKIAKPGQERRADLPTLGPATVINAKQAGLRGVAFHGGETILIDRLSMIEAADAAQLFLIGLTSDDGDP